MPGPAIDKLAFGWLAAGFWSMALPRYSRIAILALGIFSDIITELLMDEVYALDTFRLSFSAAFSVLELELPYVSRSFGVTLSNPDLA